MRFFAACLLTALAGCATADVGGDAEVPLDGGDVDGGIPVVDASVTACAPPTDCEARAADRLSAITGDTTALAAFLHVMPKGGDLHNHLTGAVYAETYLDWARSDGDCIQPSTDTVVYGSMCSASTQPVPAASAPLYGEIVRAWSMQDFVAGAETGHDHFFATFAKYGAVAGAHRDEDIADVATRAAAENEVYVETMFNLGKDVGALSASVWSGTLTAADLPMLYTMLKADPGFAAALSSDVGTVRAATRGWQLALDCGGLTPPAACDVEVRFVAQVSRTGGSDQVFGQLVSAFEMAMAAPELVAANLSSPEDDSRSLSNYALHMAMLDFLHTQYAGTSPLHVTLHAGELTRAFLPAGSTDDTFHIRSAVETGHAERIGHGLDVMSETDPSGLMDEMRDRHVLVEVCLSSNDQILGVSGAAHPLAAYLSHGVPVALATDDQGVSRSSLAGEHLRAVVDQHLDYRQLKTLARQSLEHAFLPGASLWSDVTTATPTTECTPLTDPPSPSCATFLAASERARGQQELEHRFAEFERTLVVP